jgi:hypothetical protein
MQETAGLQESTRLSTERWQLAELKSVLEGLTDHCVPR